VTREQRWRVCRTQPRRGGNGGRRRRNGAQAPAPAQVVAAVRRVSHALETVLNPETAAWATLVGLTAGEGLRFNRAFLLRLHGERLEGWFGVGPRTREEGAALWHDLRQNGIDPLAGIDHPDAAVIQAEQQRHAPLLAALSCPLEDASCKWQRPLIVRRGHPVACVRHWLAVLGSDNLAVIPIVGAGQLWGVVLADNFINHRPIPPTILEAAATMAHALRAAVERIELLTRLSEEERRRITAEHAAAMLEAARTLAHDLKNPLALAGGLASELAQAVGEGQDDLARTLRAIGAAIRNAESRLEELVASLARGATGTSLTAVDVGEAVARVVAAFEPLAARRGVRLEFQGPEAPLIAAAVPSYLDRCLENLVGNALEALEAAHVSGGCVQVAVESSGDLVAVVVADNGPPLPMTMRMDPFSGGVSTRESGAGLGLASVQRLVHAMQGRVEYDDSLPGWVRFSILLRRWV